MTLRPITSVDLPVSFLQETNIVPNLVHLDSWDVNLKNPLPCALHGWREFVAIEDYDINKHIELLENLYNLKKLDILECAALANLNGLQHLNNLTKLW